MRVSRFLVLVALILVLPVCGLTPLAYASPPDPSWIRGIYDGADYDDVVLLITSGTGTVAPTLLENPQPVPPLVGRALELEEERISFLQFPSLPSRAPPAP
jgi:hypothetical protein